MPYKRKTV